MRDRRLQALVNVHFHDLTLDRTNGPMSAVYVQFVGE